MNKFRSKYLCWRANVLAGRFAKALYTLLIEIHGDAHFYVLVNGQRVRCDVTGGVQGMREIVDGFVLDMANRNPSLWKDIGPLLLKRSVKHSRLTDFGLEVWEAVKGDIGNTLAMSGGDEK